MGSFGVEGLGDAVPYKTYYEHVFDCWCWSLALDRCLSCTLLAACECSLCTAARECGCTSEDGFVASIVRAEGAVNALVGRVPQAVGTKLGKATKFVTR